MTIQELEDWNKDTPKTIRTVAEDLAFKRVYNAQKELAEFKEVADRTEGRAPQSIDMTTKGEKIGNSTEEIAKLIQGIIQEDDSKTDKDNSDINS
jgi:predicted transcriptional regulator